jgi:hypothetical protein
MLLMGFQRIEKQAVNAAGLAGRLSSVKASLDFRPYPSKSALNAGATLFFEACS